MSATCPISSCVVYNRGDAPDVETVLGEGWGWFVVLGFGLFFTAFSMSLTKLEQNVLGTRMTSEHFNTAGRNVGAGLTAAVIVSQWTWAATLLMSSNMGWRVGVSGPFWYASGATVQILLFAVLAIQVKRRASHMHTFMEIVKARFGTVTHLIMIFFALMANMIVTAMLLLGGAGTIADLTGMSKIWAAFTIPLLACWVHTMHGGLRATFFASYVHTTIIFLVLILFTFAVYAGAGDDSNLYGSPDKVWNGLEAASLHGIFDATKTKDEMASAGKFSGLGTFILNDGTCYNEKRESTEKSCYFEKLGLDDFCCEKKGLKRRLGDSYCRADEGDCIDVSMTEHYRSSGCDRNERCVPSFLTMGSPSGALFGITNIVGNFGTVFVDQSYWQSAVAAKPKSAVMGFLIGGMVWFAVPFAMATTNGLAGRALTTHPDLGPLYLTADASGNGLAPARVMAHILGSGGAFILLMQLFMAITSTGSAEIIAVSSILTYDVYYEYINPELKSRRVSLKKTFYNAVAPYETAVNSGTVLVSNVQKLLDDLVVKKFFEVAGAVSAEDQAMLGATISSYALEGKVSTADLYNAVNRAVSANSIEGAVLLRVSKFFTGVFAIFMGFLALFLQTLGFGLGWVYMSMGVIIGSAVGPASLTILMETANGAFIGAGAVGGLMLGLLGWCVKAYDDNGEISYETLGQDWPWVVGNLCAIFGGFGIALLGSVLRPDRTFKWEMLNERIPLVDDIEPPRDEEETDEKLEMQVNIAVVASVSLTFILLVLWPLPMQFGAGVFSQMGFTLWVALEIIWTVLGGITLIGLPVYEIVDSFLKAKARKLAIEAGKSVVGSGPKLDLKINSEAAAAAASAAAASAATDTKKNIFKKNIV